MQLQVHNDAVVRTQLLLVPKDQFCAK